MLDHTFGESEIKFIIINMTGVSKANLKIIEMRKGRAIALNSYQM